MAKTRKVEDLTGRKFHKLTVLERAENYVSPQGKTKSRWKCICECGNIVMVLRNELLFGHTYSCGCYGKQRRIELGKTKKKHNNYDLSGQYGICYASNTGEEILFDLEDYDLIKDYCWHVVNSGKIKKNGEYYRRVSARNNDGKPIRLHRLIMNVHDKNLCVDHINRNTLDNRKENLRICTHKENVCNVAPYNKLNVKGVYETDNHRYSASININGQVIYLGTYDTIKEAADVYDAKAKETFGEFAYLNNYEIINPSETEVIK